MQEESQELDAPPDDDPDENRDADDDDEADKDEETRHFLHHDAAGLSSSPRHGGDALPAAQTAVSSRRAVLLCVLFLFLVEFSLYIMEPPLQDLMEDFVCHAMYPDHIMISKARANSPDERCKKADVQTTFAMARSWLMFTTMFVPLLVQVPYGVMADKYGRRPVMFCGILGLVLSTAWNIVVLRCPDTFSVWHMLFGSCALLIGGGIPVIEAIAWTILTDSTAPSERTSVFYRIYATMMILSAGMRPLAAWLLSIDPWLPMWVSLVALVLSMLSTFLIPETLRAAKTARATATSSPGHDPHYHRPRKKHVGCAGGMLGRAAEELSRIWHFVLASRSVMLLVFANSLCNLVYMAFETNLLQYVSVRFHWDWSTATLLTTVNKATSVVLLLAVLPLVSALMTRRLGYTSEPERDMHLARASVLFVTAGSLLTAFAAVSPLLVASLVVFSLGSGFEPQLRTLLTLLVAPEAMATLSTTLSTVETLVALAGVPVLGWLLGRGIELGGMWMGLPFFFAAACAAVAAGTLMAFRMPEGNHVGGGVEEGYRVVGGREGGMQEMEMF